jgi:hypothetical protein
VSRVVVREASVNDAAAIADLHVRAWQMAYRGIVPDAILDGMSIDWLGGERTGPGSRSTSTVTSWTRCATDGPDGTDGRRHPGRAPDGARVPSWA